MVDDDDSLFGVVVVEVVTLLVHPPEVVILLLLVDVIPASSRFLVRDVQDPRRGLLAIAVPFRVLHLMLRLDCSNLYQVGDEESLLPNYSTTYVLYE